MNDLSVATVQFNSFFGNKKKNRKAIETQIQDLGQQADIIVLPEMFSTGFITENPATYAEPIDGETGQWMRQISVQHHAAIVGSFIVEEKGLFFNRMLWMEPDGSFTYYDKSHLFSLGSEDKEFHAGKNRKIVVSYKDWRFLLTICYDIRFPAWMRNHEASYDAIINIANWPEKRQKQWNILLQARALENQAYVIASNRVGKDHKGYNHNGGSCVVSPTGELIFSVYDKEECTCIRLSKDKLKFTRKAYPFLKDADKYEMKP